MKNTAFLASLAVLPFLSLPSHAATTMVPVVASCGTPPQTYNAGGNYQLTQDTTGKLCIAGTFSASVTTTGFRPTSIGTPITASVGGATGSLPSNGGTVLAENNSTTIPAYCALGGSGSANAVLIAPLSSVAFTISGDTQMTCYTGSSTASILLQGGSGLATGWGGGGGTGGSSSNASVGATGSTIPASATYIGGVNGGNLVGAIVDSSGRQIVAGAGTAGSAVGGIVTVQGVTSMTPLLASLNTSPSLANGNGVVLANSAGSAIDATHGSYNNLLQGNAVVSATNGTYANVLTGNAAVSASNPLLAQLSNGTVALDATHGTYVNNLQGNAVLSATNGMFTNVLQGNAVLSATNGLYTNLLQANAVIGTSNPLSTAIVASGGAITATGTNLNVQCANCSGSGVSAADGASWTVNSSLLAPSGGVYQTTVTSNPLTAGTEGTWQLTHYRAGMVDWYNASGTEMGTSGSPVQVSLANTGSNATAVAVRRGISSVAVQCSHRNGWEPCDPCGHVWIVARRYGRCDKPCSRRSLSERGPDADERSTGRTIFGQPGRSSRDAILQWRLCDLRMPVQLYAEIRSGSSQRRM